MRRISPAQFELLVERELRKAGFEPGRSRRLDSGGVTPDGEGEYVIRLAVPLTAGGARHSAVVECRCAEIAPGAGEVHALAEAAAGTASHALLFFTAREVSGEARSEAEAAGVALLRVIDGRSAFQAYITDERAPAWLPEHAAQLLTRTAEGGVAWRLLGEGSAAALLVSPAG